MILQGQNTALPLKSNDPDQMRAEMLARCTTRASQAANAGAELSDRATARAMVFIWMVLSVARGMLEPYITPSHDTLALCALIEVKGRGLKGHHSIDTYRDLSL